ncbi:MAG: DUF2069 domain-containing protein [Halofilum sp. (in: g-proteobacteria)]
MTLTYRAATLAGYFGLLALLLNWFTWIAPPERMPIPLVLILTTVPLLFPLRGLLHGRPYTHAWASFLALPYFILGVDAVAAGTEPVWLGWAAIVFSTTLFTASVGYTRYRGQELQQTGS